MHSAYGTRLLSIGEIFDRAVHVTIANLLPLAAIIGLVEVPARAIIDWTSRDGQGRSFITDGKVIADPGLLANYFTLIKDPNAHGFNWPVLLWSLASLFPLSVAVAAASIASQGFLTGETPDLGAAYRSAIRRLAPIVGASVLAWAIYLAIFVVVVIVEFFFLVVWLLIIQARGGTVVATAGEITVVTMLVSIVAAIAWLTPLANCIFAGAALYPIRPFQALREARTMTMSRGLRVRSLAFGAAILALTLVQEFIRLIVCGFLSDVTHSPWPSFVASDAITLLALIYGMALAVVFYLDARNRVGLFQDPLAEQENSRSQ